MAKPMDGYTYKQYKQCTFQYFPHYSCGRLETELTEGNIRRDAHYEQEERENHVARCHAVPDRMTQSVV